MPSTPGLSVAVWEGFSLRWFASAWHNTAVQEATIRSAVIAVVAATIATVGRHHGGDRHHAHAGPIAA